MVEDGPSSLCWASWGQASSCCHGYLPARVRVLLNLDIIMPTVCLPTLPAYTYLHPTCRVDVHSSKSFPAASPITRGELSDTVLSSFFACPLLTEVSRVLSETSTRTRRMGQVRRCDSSVGYMYASSRLKYGFAMAYLPRAVASAGSVVACDRPLYHHSRLMNLLSETSCCIAHRSQCGNSRAGQGQY